MISLFIIIIALVLSGVFLWKNKSKIDGISSGLELKHIKVIGVAVIIFICGIACSIIQPFSIERVDAGYVGVKVKLVGDDRGVGKFEYKTGYVIINDWFEKLYEFPTFQQHIEYERQDVITKGGFSAAISPTFNYSLKPDRVGDMFSNLRLPLKEIEHGWLQTAILTSINNVANRWAVDSIFNDRERFENSIISEVNKHAGGWFVISQLRTNILPPPSLKENIEKKTNAIQQVQVAENNKLVAIAQGETMIAEARADSASKVIAASGEANAIRLKQLTLTPLYIDYLKIDKWDGANSQVVTGGSTLLNVGIK